MSSHHNYTGLAGSKRVKAIFFFFLFRLPLNLGSVDQMKKKKEKHVKKYHKKSENRRLKPQYHCLGARHGHQIDTKSIWQEI